MKIYNFHPITRELISEGKAEKSPLDDTYLIPANATDHAPTINPNENEVLVLNDEGDRWSRIKDFRGQFYWLENGTKVEILELGHEIPENALFEEPDTRSLDEAKQEAVAKVDQSHAEFLRNLTGNATIEERDTWQAKALACEAISSGTASEIQTEMIATEAQIMGEEIETLITKILTRYGAYQKLIGLASGLKRKTQATIDQCTTKEQIDQVLEQSSQQADQYVQQWMQG